jgi:hypothetical protein
MKVRGVVISSSPGPDRPPGRKTRGQKAIGHGDGVGGTIELGEILLQGGVVLVSPAAGSQ